MKKMACILLAFVLLLALAACGTGNSTTPGESSSPASTVPESPEPDGESPAAPPEDVADDATKEDIIKGLIGDDVEIFPEFLGLVGGSVGYITDDVDHQARDTYQFVLVGNTSSSATTNTFNGFVQFSKYFNYEIEQSYSDNDNDKFITLMETYALQGKNGFILNPDNNVFDRIKEVADELEIPYIFILTPYKDEDGHNLVPCVGEDDYTDGSNVMNWLLDNYQDRLGDINMDDVGVMAIGWSVVKPFAVRAQAAEDVWNERFPGREDQFYFIDTAAQDNPVTQEAAYNEVAAFVSAHPEIKYWIIPSGAGLFANGAARALESLNVDQNCIICSIGIEELINEWNAGYDGCWAACLSIKPNIYSMPMLAGLLAMADGRATPETLWQEVRAEGDKATYYIMDTTVITRDTYKQYGEACDILAAKYTVE